MKTHDADEFEFDMSVHPRPKEAVTLEMPKDAVESLKKVAASRDMSLEALLRLYIGHGLRQDMSKLFADRVLETTAHVLARHIHSEDEISSIIREIRVEAVGVK